MRSHGPKTLASLFFWMDKGTLFNVENDEGEGELECFAIL
jgi:hypothetical protein